MIPRDIIRAYLADIGRKGGSTTGSTEAQRLAAALAILEKRKM